MTEIEKQKEYEIRLYNTIIQFAKIFFIFILGLSLFLLSLHILRGF